MTSAPLLRSFRRLFWLRRFDTARLAGAYGLLSEDMFCSPLKPLHRVRE